MGYNIIRKTIVSLGCDFCSKVSDAIQLDGALPIQKAIQEAIDEMQTSWVIVDGKVYCEDCRKKLLPWTLMD